MYSDIYHIVSHTGLDYRSSVNNQGCLATVFSLRRLLHGVYRMSRVCRPHDRRSFWCRWATSYHLIIISLVTTSFCMFVVHCIQPGLCLICFHFSIRSSTQYTDKIPTSTSIFLEHVIFNFVDFCFCQRRYPYSDWMPFILSVHVLQMLQHSCHLWFLSFKSKQNMSLKDKPYRRPLCCRNVSNNVCITL